MRIGRRNAAAGATVLVALIALLWLVRDRIGLGSGPDRDDAREGRADNGDGDGQGGSSDPSGSLFDNWNDSVQEVDENGNPIMVTVTGRVFDMSTGDAVGGIEVIFRGRGAEFTAISGGDGRYSLALGIARYSVAAVGSDSYGLAERELTVARSREAVDYDIGVIKLAHVTGAVVDAQNRAVPGAMVTFETRRERGRFSSNDLEQYMSVASSAESDDTGKFAIDVIPGEVLVIAELDGAFGRASLPAVAGGSQVSATIVLDASVSVAGTVVDGERRPVAEAKVNVTVVDRALGGRTSRDVTTGTDGSFQINKLAPGFATIEARTERGASALTFRTLASGEAATGVTLVIEPPLSVAGRVIDSNGSPLAEVIVFAHRSRAKAPPPSDTTDDDGQFAIDGLGPGDYDLQAHKKHVGNQWVKGLTLPAKDVEIVLAAPGVIRGLVRASTGKPVSSFSISVAQMTSTLDGNTRQGWQRGTQFASEDGLFELPISLPGTYYLIATASGFAPSAPTRVDVSAGGSGKVEFRLDGGGKVTGQVVGKADGRPVAGAQVNVLVSPGGATAATDANGKFVLEGVPSGRRTVRAVHTGHVAVTMSEVNVETGRTTEIQLEMAPADAADADKLDVSGIGAVVDQLGTDVRIFTVIEGGPAERAGLRAGDVIATIDSADTAGMPLAEAVERLRGRPGTAVTLEVRRKGETFSAKLARDVVRAAAPRRGAIASVQRRSSCASTQSDVSRVCSGAIARST